jgi:5-methylcytosine-specific restriction endonuclease McrA
LKKPNSPKERNLLKGALRRVFGRSELRNKVLDRHNIDYIDPTRPRVTRWSFCGECGVVEPRYKMQIDHILPVIRLDETLEDLSWTELIEERLWCDESNLMPICLPCHKQKSKIENKLRREYKKGKK